ncbi:PQQ-dependent sugar dehydrogenase [Frankia sp. AgKG'84/4]
MARTRLLVALALATALALAACGSPGSAGSSGSASAGRPSPSALAGPTGADAAAATGVQTRTVADGLAAPWDIAFLPSGEALVSERDSGRILRVPAGGGRPTTMTTLPGVLHQGESGLLGLAVSPTFARDQFVYAYYTTSSDNRIVRFRLDGTRAEAPTPILTGLAHGVIHNGGRIRFGPDGLLYVGVGDTGVRTNAQNLASRNGKILRIRPDGTIPADNPFPGSPVYSLGHRNVQGLAWDSAGRMWASEFGQDRFDEINLIVAGGNYGWPVVEGDGDTDGGRYRRPLATWPVADASPSGIGIRGNTMYVAALRGQRLWELDLAGATVRGEPRAVLDGVAGRLRAAVAAPDGSIWILTNNTDGRGEPRPGDDRILALR